MTYNILSKILTKNIVHIKIQQNLIIFNPNNYIDYIT